MAGPCAIEGEKMAMEIAEKVVAISERLKIPYVFKGSYRKANRSRIDSFTGIGDEKALRILGKVKETFNIPVVTDIHTAEEADKGGNLFERVIVLWLNRVCSYFIRSGQSSQSGVSHL